jgi:hypothetical protein
VTNAIHKFFLVDEAKLRTFETILTQTADAVVFIGDSIIPPTTVPQHSWGSIGLIFWDRGLVKRVGPGEPQFCDVRDVNQTTHTCADPSAYVYTKLFDKIASNAKVVLIASCDIGDKFKSLWDINENSTNRSLIVPSTLGSTDLFRAAKIFIATLESLVSGTAKHPRTVSDAVADGNTWGRNHGISLQFTPIGGGNVSVK